MGLPLKSLKVRSSAIERAALAIGGNRVGSGMPASIQAVFARGPRMMATPALRSFPRVFGFPPP